MADFFLYPRKRKGGKPVSYAQFKNPVGTYTIARTTKGISRCAVDQYCEAYLIIS